MHYIMSHLLLSKIYNLVFLPSSIVGTAINLIEDPGTEGLSLITDIPVAFHVVLGIALRPCDDSPMTPTLLLVSGLYIYKYIQF